MSKAEGYALAILVGALTLFLADWTWTPNAF